MRKTLTIALTLGSVLLISNANATVIGFEDMTSRANFSASSLGNVLQTYNGYKWGYSPAAGASGWSTKVFPNTTQTQGWASAQNPPTANAPFPGAAMPAGSGSGYAWDQAGSASLWIDFNGNVDFNGAMYGPARSNLTGNNNALGVTFKGYNATGTLVATSGALSSDLSSFTWSTYTASSAFDNISFLEIVPTQNNLNSLASGRGFVLDNLNIGTVGAVPDFGSTAGLLGLGMSGLFFLRRKS